MTNHFNAGRGAAARDGAAVGLAMILLAASFGCGERAKPAAGVPARAEFEPQLQAVLAGASDRIVVTDDVVADDDLQAVAECEPLRELILDGGRISDEGVEHLRPLKKLEHVRLRNSPIADRGLGALAELPALRILNLPQAEFTDAGLAELSSASELQLLRFHSDHITDDGLRYIAELPSLRFLHLIDVPITAAGLKHLASMRSLESLYLDEIDLPDAAIGELLKQLPNLHLHIDQRHHDLDPHRH